MQTVLGFLIQMVNSELKVSVGCYSDYSNCESLDIRLSQMQMEIMKQHTMIPVEGYTTNKTKLYSGKYR